MATNKTPVRVNDDVRPQSNLSQILARGPRLSVAYGRSLGGLILRSSRDCRASDSSIDGSIQVLVRITKTFSLRGWYGAAGRVAGRLR